MSEPANRRRAGVSLLELEEMRPESHRCAGLADQWQGDEALGRQQPLGLNFNSREERCSGGTKRAAAASAQQLMRASFGQVSCKLLGQRTAAAPHRDQPAGVCRQRTKERSEAPADLRWQWNRRPEPAVAQVGE